MSGFEECNKQYTYKPLTRLGRRKKRRYWNKFVDEIMSDRVERTSTRLHEELLDYAEKHKKKAKTYATWRNLPSSRQVASYLHYSKKYDKTEQPRRGPHNKWTWVMKDDV